MQMVVVRRTTKYNQTRTKKSTVVTMEPVQKYDDEDTKFSMRLVEQDDPRYGIGARVNVSFAVEEKADERHEKD